MSNDAFRGRLFRVFARFGFCSGITKADPKRTRRKSEKDPNQPAFLPSLFLQRLFKKVILTVVSLIENSIILHRL
jgi:hypothetical protein